MENVIIARKKGFAGVAIDIHLTIDEEHYNLKNGQELKFTLSEGEHIIKYKVWNRREKSITLQIVPDKEYKILFKYDALWGGFKLDKSSILN